MLITVSDVIGSGRHNGFLEMFDMLILAVKDGLGRKLYWFIVVESLLMYFLCIHLGRRLSL